MDSQESENSPLPKLWKSKSSSIIQITDVPTTILPLIPLLPWNQCGMKLMTLFGKKLRMLLNQKLQTLEERTFVIIFTARLSTSPEPTPYDGINKFRGYADLA
jgi:hypothetical protein